MKTLNYIVAVVGLIMSTGAMARPNIPVDDRTPNWVPTTFIKDSADANQKCPIVCGMFHQHTYANRWTNGAKEGTIRGYCDCQGANGKPTVKSILDQGIGRRQADEVITPELPWMDQTPEGSSEDVIEQVAAPAISNRIHPGIGRRVATVPAASPALAWND